MKPPELVIEKRYAGLKRRIESHLEEFVAGVPLPISIVLEDLNEVMDLLETGTLRIMEMSGGEWILNRWLKEAIYLGFKIGKNGEFSIDDKLFFHDKELFPIRRILKEHCIRILGPSAAIRRGAFVGKDCVLMPPAYVNVGAYVDEGTMIESLAGSCCSIGRNCHISANTTIGGVLSPLENHPVVIGHNVLVGEGAGVTQGTRIGNNVAIAPGVHITKSATVLDCVNELAYCYDGTYSIENVGGRDYKVYRKGGLIEKKDVCYGPIVPDNALVINGQIISENGNIKVTPMIIKYIEEGGKFLEDTNFIVRWS